MKTYIALLRGINVSGQKMIKMAELKTHFEALGYQDVQTYIQSGNIVFKAAGTTPSSLEQAISEKIREVYGFEVAVTVRRPEDLRHILDNNPFLQRGEDPERLYVTFLGALPAAAQVEKLKEYDYSPEAYILDGATLYFFAPNGYGRAKMNNNFFESKLKVSCTTRNWKTVQVLAEMAGG